VARAAQTEIFTRKGTGRNEIFSLVVVIFSNAGKIRCSGTAFVFCPKKMQQ
jgi:hypothetical protein